MFRGRGGGVLKASLSLLSRVANIHKNERVCGKDCERCGLFHYPKKVRTTNNEAYTKNRRDQKKKIREFQS